MALSLEKKFYDLCAPVVGNLSLDLYDLEYLHGSTCLRLYIQDKETKTASLEDCVRVDKALSEPFEELSWIPQSIVLEVSSPGVFRKLRTKEHFASAVGENIKLTLKAYLSEESDFFSHIGKEKNLEGKLEKVEGEQIFVNYKNKIVALEIESIRKSNLEPDVFNS